MSEGYNPWRGNWLSIRDTPNWQQKYPPGNGGVRFDVRCNHHNIEYKEILAEKLPGCPQTFRRLLTCCFRTPESVPDWSPEQVVETLKDVLTH